jgi:hypothetical protein
MNFAPSSAGHARILESRGRPDAKGDHLYLMPSLDQLFEFVAFYVKQLPKRRRQIASDASRRWKNAVRVRFNIETKTNPREPEVTKRVGEFVAGRQRFHRRPLAEEAVLNQALAAICRGSEREHHEIGAPAGLGARAFV